MIAYIRGTLAEKEPARVVVEAAGVGYELWVPLSTFDRLPKAGAGVKLLAWHCVREDDEQLFGFATEAERDLFVKLTQVSGVGPKIALALLSGCSVPEMGLAIASGNAKRLASVKGVGKKTAEKICLELKDKVSAIEALSASSGRGEGSVPAAPAIRDAVMALSALGFNEETASKMVTQAVAADPSPADAETLVRRALAGGAKI